MSHSAAGSEVVHAGHLGLQQQVDLGVIVGPGAELERAVLLVEGEVLDLDLAGALVNGRREPGDAPLKRTMALVKTVTSYVPSALWSEQKHTMHVGYVTTTRAF